jgi:Effector protein
MPPPHHAHLHPHHPPKHLHYHHVTIDGTGTTHYKTVAEYERAVLRDLRRIHHSHTGHAIFHEFVNRTHHLMKIVPYEETPLNAYAKALDLRRATPKGEVERDGYGKPILDAAGKPITGLGGGSDAEVHFTPSIWVDYCNKQKKGHKSGAQPDEILFHEMTHATREMRGLLNTLPLGFLYDTEEEFFAILLANIYASETGRPIDIRSDHHGFLHLTTDTDATFLPKKDMTDYRYRLVAKLVHQEPRMAHELGRLKHIPFNPIRRYFELQRTSVHVHH